MLFQKGPEKTERMGQVPVFHRPRRPGVKIPGVVAHHQPGPRQWFLVHQPGLQVLDLLQDGMGRLLQSFRLRHRQAGKRAMRHHQLHAPFQLVGRQPVLAVRVPMRHQVRFAEGHPVVGGRPDLRVAKSRHNRVAPVAFIHPEFLVRRVKQQVQPGGHVPGHTEKMPPAPSVRAPGDQGKVLADPLQSGLHLADQTFQSPVRPMLIQAEFLVFHVGRWNFLAGFRQVVFAAVLAETKAAMVQAVKTECGNLGVNRGDLCQYLDEKIPIGPQQAQHATMRFHFQVHLGDFSISRCHATPIRMGFIHLRLQAGRVHTQNVHPQPAVFRDILRNPVRGHMRTSLFQQLAVVVGVEGIDESHLAQRHSGFCGLFPCGTVHD